MSGRGESPVADVIKLFSVVIHTSAERSWPRSQKKNAPAYSASASPTAKKREKKVFDI